MADVTIEGSSSSYLSVEATRGGIFWTTPLIGYVVYIDSSYDLKYRKTSDGGATWGAAVNIRTGQVLYYDCLADWQVVGDAGTKIHIVYEDSDTDDVRYVYLDTSGDSVGGDDQIEACQGTGAFYNYYYRQPLFSITKTRGGNLAVAFRYRDSTQTNFYGFYTSPDGDTWTSKASPWEGTTDYLLLFSGNEADNQDVWAVFWDKSADEISLKTYDDSEDSWSEQSIAGAMADYTGYLQMDGAVRLSDGHLILAAWNRMDNAASDLMTWDINGAGSITAKTNIITNEADTFLASVFINQVNDDVYIAYASGTSAQSAVKVFYQKSTDGCANWGGETALQANAEDDERWISAGAMKASWGGKFQPCWFNDDLNDLFTNTDNGVSIAAGGVGHYDRSGTAYLGLVGVGTRPVGCVRSDTGLLGLLSTATRSWALTREDTALLGLKATASRIITPIRAQTALLGLKATASQAVDYAAKTGTALLGLVATGSRTIALSRSKAALLGLKATGVMSTLGHYTKEAVVYLGLAVTGTRSIVLARADTALLGLKATATKAITLTRADTALLGLKAAGILIIPYIRTATAYLGLKITASRSFALTRLNTALLGLKGIATRSLVLSRAQTALLGLKVIGILGAPGRALKLIIVTTQKRQVNVITSLYRKIKILTE